MATEYPTKLIVNGVSYTAERGESLANGGDRNVYIDFYRDDISYKAHAHMGSFFKTIAQVNPHDILFMGECDAAQDFCKSGWSSASQEEWEALQAAFLAGTVFDANEDTSPYVVAETDGPLGLKKGFLSTQNVPALEEMALASYENFIMAGGTATHLDYLGEDYDDL